MNKENESKKSGPLGVVLTFVQMILILLLVAVAIMSFGSRVPLLSRLGLNFFAVTSGSMEPAIPTGSLVYTGKYRLDLLKKGDILTYRKDNPETKESAIVTHRIDEIKKTEDKQQVDDNGKKVEKTVVNYIFKTKGDANNTVDSYEVRPFEIIGLYKWHVAKLGYISLFAQQPSGFALLVILPAAILILWELGDLILHFKKQYKDKSEKEIAILKAELEKHKKENA